MVYIILNKINIFSFNYNVPIIVYFDDLNETFWTWIALISMLILIILKIFY